MYFIHKAHRKASSTHLFSFSEPQPQLDSSDEELHQLIVLRFGGCMVQLSLLCPEKQSSWC